MSSSRPITAIGSVARGSPPTSRGNRPNARFAIRRPNGSPSRLATTMASSGVTESATTATIRGRGASTSAAGAAASASAEDRRPSPRTATAAIAVIPPIDEPTSATRRTPRSPRRARAPATSSTSSSPNVVGPSSDPPCPRKSRPQHARGPAQERSHLDQVGRDRAVVPVEQQDRLAGVRDPAVRVGRGIGRQPASHQADAVPGAEADHLAAQPVQRRRQAGLLRQASRRPHHPPGEPVQHGTHRDDRQERRGGDEEDAPDHRSPLSALIPCPT